MSGGRAPDVVDVIHHGLHVQEIEPASFLFVLGEDAAWIGQIGRKQLALRMEGDRIGAFGFGVGEEPLHEVVVGPELIAKIRAAVVAGAQAIHKFDLGPQGLFPFPGAAVRDGQIVAVGRIHDFVTQDDVAFVGAQHLFHAREVAVAPQADDHNGFTRHLVELRNRRAQDVFMRAVVALKIEVESVQVGQRAEDFTVTVSAIPFDFGVLHLAETPRGRNLVLPRQFGREVAHIVLKQRLQPVAVGHRQAALQGRAHCISRLGILAGRVGILRVIQHVFEEMVAGVEDQAVELAAGNLLAERFPDFVRIVGDPARAAGLQGQFMLVVAGAQAQVTSGVGPPASAQAFGEFEQSGNHADGGVAGDFHRSGAAEADRVVVRPFGGRKACQLHDRCSAADFGPPQKSVWQLAGRPANSVFSCAKLRPGIDLEHGVVLSGLMKLRLFIS